MSNTASSSSSTNPEIELVGGPFAVIESDPGVFTSLARNLGIRGLEVVELYDIEPWAVDRMNPRGLIFCFLWRKDRHRPADFEDPAAGRVWFANQLIDDACASQAILNVVLNCPDVDVGPELQNFRRETEKMSATMKGLAISNLPLVRRVHNALARPPDIRGATFVVAQTTLDTISSKTRTSRTTNSAKRRQAATRVTKTAKKPIQRKPATETIQGEESYHFIGYVPAYGKVWELDGLKSGPLEVGELPSPSPSMGGSKTKGWMDIVRPALRMKMRKYGGTSGGSNIKFSLLALVDDQYQAANDDFELLKREKRSLERRLDEAYPSGWESKVHPDILALAAEAFSISGHSATGGSTFAADFGNRGLQKDMAILDMPERNLISAWQDCVKAALPARIMVEDEISKSLRAHTDHIKRTHDYEPFIRQFVTCLQNEGLLNPLLEGEDLGEGAAKKSKAEAKSE